jgi:hypothetical protein
VEVAVQPPYRDYTDEPLSSEPPAEETAPRPGHGTVWLTPLGDDEDDWMVSWQDEGAILRGEDAPLASAVVWARAQPAAQRLVFVMALNREVQLDSTEARTHLGL